MSKSKKKKRDEFLKLLESFITQYLTDIRGFSEKTKESYSATFRLLIQYMKEKLNVSVDDITFDILDYDAITGFLQWLEKERNNSNTTKNTRLAAIKSFAKYAENYDFASAACFAKNVRKINPIHVQNQSRAYFTLPEVKLLIGLPNINTIAGRRNAVLLAFMFVTAARGDEICKLKVKDILFADDSRMKVTLHGKGNKTRRVIVCTEIAALMKKFLHYRRISNVLEAYVFDTQNHPQMSISCIEEIFKKYISIAKKDNPQMFTMSGYSPHSMRHTTAICMLTSGVPLSVIQRFLGHSNITTTQIYAEYTQPALDDAIIKWNNSFWSHISEDVNLIENDIPVDDTENNLPYFLR